MAILRTNQLRRHKPAELGESWNQADRSLGIQTTAARKAGPQRARLGSPAGESEQTKQ